MAELLGVTTSDTTGSGVSHTGPCTVFVKGTFDGCTVYLEMADTDTAADYAKPKTAPGEEPLGVFTQPGSVDVAGRGTYFIRAVVKDSGTDTSIEADSTQ